MFPNLKLQIFRRDTHQNRLARTLGIDETVLSKIIHGYRNPTQAQRKLLATYLEADEEWLFECLEVAPARVVRQPAQTTAGQEASRDGDV